MIAKPRQMIVIQSNDKKEFVKKFNAALPTENDIHIMTVAKKLFEGSNEKKN